MRYQHTDTDGDWIRVEDDGTFTTGNRYEDTHSTGDRAVHVDYDAEWIAVEGGGQVYPPENMTPDEFADLLRAHAAGTVTADTADRKPRGVKAQWHMVPMRALIAIEAESGRGSTVARALSDYQDKPNVKSAARLGAVLLNKLHREGGGLDTVIKVFEHGAQKYGLDNWQGAAEDMTAFRREYYSAICRHTLGADGPIDALPEGSGLLHSAHAVCTALMIMWHEQRIAQ